MTQSSLRWTTRLLGVLSGAAAVATVLVFADGPADSPAARLDTLGTAASVGLRLDRVSVLLLLLVVVLAWVAAAFAGRQLDDAPARRFATRLVAAVVALGVTVTAASLPLLALAWTAAAMAVVGLVAVGGDAASRAAAATVRRRLLVGDAFLWAGVVVAAATLPDLDRRALPATVAAAGDGTLLVVAGLLALGGAARSALVPFHRWLPETTAAPTPVSAQLHGGFVNGLGVLGVLWWPLFAASAPVRVGLVAIGVVTALVATAQMRARSDVKGRLVSSTSAQMGYMGIELGVGVPAAALLHLLGHGCYKAALFLGSGSAVHPGPRVQSHGRPGALAWVAAAALALGVVLAAHALGFPASGVAAFLLLGAAWATLTTALAPILASDRPTVRRARLSAVVVAIGAAALLATAWFKDALADAVAPTPTWATASAIALGALLAAAFLAAWVVDHAIRGGRLTRVHAWARRGALPPRLPRPRAGAAVVPLAAGPVSRATRATTRAIADQAARVVAPTYPLTAFVASNPLARLESLPVDEALRHAAAARGDVHLDGFAPLPGEDAPSEEALLRALGDDGDLLPVLRAHTEGLRPTPGAVAAAHAALERLTHPPAPVATPAELVDLGCGTRLVELVRTEVALWCAAWADQEIAAWPTHPAGAGLWATWRTHALPGADRALGAPGFAAAAAALPDRADEAVAVLLDAMGADPADRAALLARAIGRLPGWAAHCAWRVAHRHDDGAQPTELLAVLLATEFLLADAVARRRLGCPARLAELRAALTGRGVDVSDAARTAAARDLAVGATALGLDLADPAADATVVRLLGFDAVARALVLIRAAEESDRAGLLSAVAHRAPDLPPRPEAGVDAQVVCCIDVRSERLRRNLEAAGGVETFGFAGFFGVPFHFRPPGTDVGIDQCPVLVTPRNVVTEAAADPGGADLGVTLRRRADAAVTHDAVEAVETEPVAPFALAESLGALFGLGAVVRTFAPRATAAMVHRPGAPATRIALDGTDGFAFEERAYLGEAALRTFGLTRDFARIVLLCGHDASTVNNPYGTAYKCGACGGQGGAPNARALAAILNDPDVRARLAERGLVVPDTTRFVAAVHDTTTDTVDVLDPDAVPMAWRDDLAALRARIDTAARATALERWTRRPGLATAPRNTRSARRAAARRAADWAQVRPEWGLAGNLAFVAAPRTLTTELDLDGRVFLHSYEWEHDPDGAALEVILTAPLVVAEWINTQYWCSAVAPDTFGAGDKARHNVVGGFGVLTGPRGDLRIGLPRQAVYAADGTRVHPPRRLLAIVRAPREVVDGIVGRTPLLTNLVDNGWIDLAVVDPTSGMIERRSRSGTWARWDPPDSLGPATSAPSPPRDDAAVPMAAPEGATTRVEVCR